MKPLRPLDSDEPTDVEITDEVCPELSILVDEALREIESGATHNS